MPVTRASQLWRFIPGGKKQNRFCYEITKLRDIFTIGTIVFCAKRIKSTITEYISGCNNNPAATLISVTTQPLHLTCTI